VGRKITVTAGDGRVPYSVGHRGGTIFFCRPVSEKSKTQSLVLHSCQPLLLTDIGSLLPHGPNPVPMRLWGFGMKFTDFYPRDAS